jgi:hypothetical protein
MIYSLELVFLFVSYSKGSVSFKFRRLRNTARIEPKTLFVAQWLGPIQNIDGMIFSWDLREDRAES